MSESNLCLINIENYNLRTSFCRQIYQKHVCIHIRKDVCYKSLDFTRHCEEKKLEICATQIDSGNNQQIILCVEISIGKFHQFLRLSQIMLRSLYRRKTEFVICENVNIDYLSDSYRKQQSM
jgi:isocitrate dehydrogenase